MHGRPWYVPVARERGVSSSACVSLAAAGSNSYSYSYGLRAVEGLPVSMVSMRVAWVTMRGNCHGASGCVDVYGREGQNVVVVKGIHFSANGALMKVSVVFFDATHFHLQPGPHRAIAIVGGTVMPPSPPELRALEAVQLAHSRASFVESPSRQEQCYKPVPISTGLQPGSPKELIALEQAQMALTRTSAMPAAKAKWDVAPSQPYAVAGTPMQSVVVN